MIEGVTNLQNLHTWANKNQNATRMYASERKFTFSVWDGFIGDCFLGPYILPEKFNGCIYLAFFQEVQSLNGAPMDICVHIRFQHVGAQCLSSGK